MDKPTNALLCIWFCRNTFVELSNLQTKISWSNEFRNSVLSGRAEVQEVHRSSEKGVTSYCPAKWGYYWLLEVECPLENSAFICILLCFFCLLVCLCFFLFFLKWNALNILWCFDPGTLMCHDFCRQEVAFICEVECHLFYLNTLVWASVLPTPRAPPGKPFGLTTSLEVVNARNIPGSIQYKSTTWCA